MNTRTVTWLSSLALALTLGGTIAGLSPQTPPAYAPRSQPVMAKPAAKFAIDSVHSSAIFNVQHLGAGRFYGRFNTLDGMFTYGEGSASDLSIEVSIPIESIDTNSDGLDGHLKSPDFFNAKDFSEMTFKSTRAMRAGDRTYTVIGDLTVRGVTRTIRPTFEWTGAGDMGMGYRCGLEARFTIKRSDFGIMYGVENGMVGDDVNVIVSMEGVRK